MHARRSPIGTVILLAVAALLAGCGPAPSPTPSPAPSVPPLSQGLDPARPIVLVETLPGPTSLPDTFDARSLVLYADGTLVVSGGGGLLATVTAHLGPEALAVAWATVHEAGLAQDASLALEGLYDAGTTRIAVDDGTRRTELLIYALGFELADDQSPFPAPEAALRHNALAAIDRLRSMATDAPWTPPSLLLWWGAYDDSPGGAVAPRVPWTAPVDLATAGAAIRHPLFARCVRLDGVDAAAVAALVRTLQASVVVEQAGKSYGLGIRPIYPDEQGVACHGL